MDCYPEKRPAPKLDPWQWLVTGGAQVGMHLIGDAAKRQFAKAMQANGLMGGSTRSVERSVSANEAGA